MAPTPRPIRWQDPTLPLHILRYVPQGYRHLGQLDAAHALGRAAFGSESPILAYQFRNMWKAALDLGWQRNGLLLMCLTALPKPAGHISNITSTRFAASCRRQQLWLKVPGKLYPHSNPDVPGDRLRAYLIIAPSV